MPLFHLRLEVGIEAEPVRNMTRVNEGSFFPEEPRLVDGIWVRVTVIRVVVVHDALHIRVRVGDAIFSRR